MKKLFIAALLGAALAAGPAQAQVYARVGPPPPVVERVGPSRIGYVWIPGHHRWNGRRYVWVSGHYARPPRRTAGWIPGRGVQRRRGGIYVNGPWR